MTHSRRARAERMVAAGRLVVALATCVAIWADPAGSFRSEKAVQILVAAYTSYAIAEAVRVRFTPSPSQQIAVVTHVTDLVFFTLLNYLTQGPTSPFFPFLVFSILCAALRFDVRVTVITAAAAILIFVAMGLYSDWTGPGFDLQRFIIRTVHLVVTGWLMIYLVTHTSRLHRELAQLAQWPTNFSGDAQSATRQMLEECRKILRAPRILLMWEEADEPWMNVAYLGGSGMEWRRDPPGAYDPLVANELEELSFFCRDVRSPHPAVRSRKDARTLRSMLSPINAAVAADFEITSLLSAPVKSEAIHGRLMALDVEGLDVDEIELADVIARLFAAGMDQTYVLEKAHQVASAEQRFRLARDLHDGVLQSLTGVALQLQSVSRLLDHDVTAARKRLADIQETVEHDQRDLRMVIQQLKPSGGGEPPRLTARLGTLAQRFQAQWGIDLDLDMKQLGTNLSPELRHEIFSLIHEAAANAAKHANATRVRVEVGAPNGSVAITVSDDGHGFPFKGEFDLNSLSELRRGPVSLRERIASLGGELTIKSTAQGSTLHIRLPTSESRTDVDSYHPG